MQPLQTDNIRLAATVMLVQDGTAGPEVYMVKRPGHGDFPDLHVFPGGKVDAGDWLPNSCPELTDERASGLLNVTGGGLRYWVAVARECFEECGVLLANNRGQWIDLSLPDNRAEWAASRARLLAGEQSWESLLNNAKLTIATDHLLYFSHWITPPSVPRRFDTRFFVAAMPHGQVALADTDETQGGTWVAPSQALALHRAGEWQMIDPTLLSLQALARFDCVNELLVGIREGAHAITWTESLGRQGMQQD